MGVIARQSIKGALANYLGVAIGFVTTFFVVTRFLTTEEVGLTRVMVDAAVLFAAIAQLGSNSSLIRFFPHFKDNQAHHGIFGMSLLVPLVGFSVVALAFLVFHDQLLELYGERSPLLTDYFYMLPMLTFFALYTTVFETGASVLMRITVPKIVHEVGYRLFNLVAYLLYGYKVISLDVFVWMFCGSYGLTMLLDMFYLYRISGLPLRAWLNIDWRFVADGGRWRDMLRYTLFMTATVLAGNIPLMSSLFLGAETGLALTGVFTIAFYIANVVEVPYRSLGAISRPVVAAAVKEENWGEVNRLTRQVSLHQLLVSLLIFYVIWINLDALFAVIPNGADYAGGAGVVLILGLAKVMNSSLSIGTDVLNYSRWYRWSLPLIGVLTVSAIVLNGVLIGLWGIDGAAAATLLSYALYFLLLLSLLWWRLRVSLFSAAQMKVLVLLVAGVALGKVWTVWVTPLLTGLAGGIGGLLIDAAVKTVVLGGAVAAAVLAWRVSPTVNGMVAGLITKK
jgi:O-antigen/teichoic acid export membrane protein